MVKLSMKIFGHISVRNGNIHLATGVTVKKHVTAVHEKAKHYKCEECPYAGATKDSLYVHVKRVHEMLRPNKCE